MHPTYILHAQHAKHTHLIYNLLQWVWRARLHERLLVLHVRERQPAVPAWPDLRLVDVDKDSWMPLWATTCQRISLSVPLLSSSPHSLPLPLPSPHDRYLPSLTSITADYPLLTPAHGLLVDKLHSRPGYGLLLKDSLFKAGSGHGKLARALTATPCAGTVRGLEIAKSLALFDRLGEGVQALGAQRHFGGHLVGGGRIGRVGRIRLRDGRCQGLYGAPQRWRAQQRAEQHAAG